MKVSNWKVANIVSEDFIRIESAEDADVKIEDLALNCNYADPATVTD